MTDLSHIPLVLLEEAKGAGLQDETIAEHWGRYVDWHTKIRGEAADYRMTDWRRQIDFAKRDQDESVPTTAESRAASKREDERRRKALEAQAYDREAMSFEAWCLSLCAKVARGEALSLHHMAVAEFYATHPDPKPRGVLGALEFGQWAARRGLHFGRVDDKPTLIDGA